MNKIASEEIPEHPVQPVEEPLAQQNKSGKVHIDTLLQAEEE